MNMYPRQNTQIILKYVLPQMFGLVCNSIYFIVDGMFVGHRLGPSALAAVGVAVPMVEFMIAFSMLIAAGTGIYISRCIGGGDVQKARTAFNNSLVFTLVISIVIAVSAFIFVEPLARFLGATETALADTVAYLRPFIAFSPFLVLSFSLSTYARNNQRPVLAMTALIMGSLLNVALDYVLMYPLDMGIFGAALATGLGPVCSVLILLPAFLGKKGNLYLQKDRWTKGLLRTVFTNGLSVFIAEFSIGLVTLLYNRAIVKEGLGDDGLAAYLVIGYAALLGLTAFLGAGEGVQPVAGYLYGKGEAGRLKSLTRAMNGFIVGAGAVFYLLILALGRSFFGFFIRDSVQLLSFTYEKSLIYFLCFIPAGLNILMISLMQCMEKSGAAFSLSVSRSIVLVGFFLWLLPILFPGNGIWGAVVCAEVISLVVGVVLSRGKEAKRAGSTYAVQGDS